MTSLALMDYHRILVSGKELQSISPLTELSPEKREEITNFVRNQLKAQQGNTVLSEPICYSAAEWTNACEALGVPYNREYYTCVRLNYETWPGNEGSFKPYPALYEEIRSYESEKDRKEWEPRMRMFKEALTAPYGKIFSLSVVPSKPWLQQTWFYQKKPIEHHEETSDYQLETLVSDQSATAECPPIALTVFVQPFERFNSELSAPEDISTTRSPTVYSIYTRQDLEPIAEDVRSPDLREKVKRIAQHFFNDGHATQLQIIILQEPGCLTKRLVKVDWMGRELK